MNIWKILPVVALLTLPLVARADDTNTVAATNALSPFDQALADYHVSLTKTDLKTVINLAEAMDKLPPTPEEARKHFVRGEVLFGDATNNPEGFVPAIKEFGEAAKAAPWVRNIRYNLALAYEANNNYAATIIQLKCYLLFKLPDDESRAVQDKIYALEVKAESANKKKAEEEQAAAEERAAKDRAEAAKREKQERATKLVQWLKEHYGGRLCRASTTITDFSLDAIDNADWRSLLRDGATSDSASSRDLRSENRYFAFSVIGENMDHVKLQTPDQGLSAVADMTSDSVENLKWYFKQNQRWLEFGTSSKDGKPWVQFLGKRDDKDDNSLYWGRRYTLEERTDR